MLTQEQVLAAWPTRDRGGVEMIDGRDATRLAQFFPESDWTVLGVKRVEGLTPSVGPQLLEVKPGKVAEVAEAHPPRPWTREELLDIARHDLAFAFEKALGKRGISADLMTSVVQMWAWILETPLPDREHYPQYGLPILKAAALAWGFDNPIGDDTGTEFKYSEHYREEAS